MTANYLEKLEQFDAYVEKLRAANWAAKSDSSTWSPAMAAQKELQESMKDCLYKNQAYWAYACWAWNWNSDQGMWGDTSLLNENITRIRTELAIKATTELITS